MYLFYACHGFISVLGVGTIPNHESGGALMGFLSSAFADAGVLLLLEGDLQQQ